MSNQKRAYDSTVARIAGNIASGLIREQSFWPLHANVAIVAETSVALARYIIAETRRTEPAPEVPHVDA